MKQVFQDLQNGNLILDNVPVPNLKRNQVLVRSMCSLISPGTEAMLTSFARANLIGKARQQPDRLKDVIKKISTDGILETYDAVKQKIESPLPLGYSNVGEILEVGEGVKGLKIGDRVASNGPHAEIFSVNQNLCALVPEDVSSEEAAFTVIASIGLNGIRLAKPTYGETFLVSGLGLIGLITSQLLMSNGCKVLGVDPDQERCDLASSYGVKSLNISRNDDQVSWCLENSENLGLDGAIIAAATNTSAPINLAAKSCRKKGRIVLVGATPIDLERDIFYKKELSFKVSCSYGPGRYDKSYEEDSNDYPLSYVRWTEKRNFETIISSISKNYLKTNKLISHFFDFDNIKDAYEILLSKDKSLGIIINYPKRKVDFSLNSSFSDFSEKDNSLPSLKVEPLIGFIGSGNYAKRILIPSFSKVGARFHSLITSNGPDSIYLGRKYSFPFVGSNVNDLFEDNKCNTIVIATRHDSHCDYVIKALEKGKNVFVEKPLCISKKELIKIQNSFKEISISNSKKPLLMVGFNRRFSPLVKELKSNLKTLNGIKSFIYTCNVGLIDNSSWINNPVIGGGRLLGEACHFLDLLRFLSDSQIEKLDILSSPELRYPSDNFILQVRFKDGSIGSINYFKDGDKSFAKERLEVFCSGTIQRIDNFKKLKVWGSRKFKNVSLIRQDKGQKNCIKEFIDAIKDRGNSPIDFNELVEIQSWILKVADKLNY